MKMRATRVNSQTFVQFADFRAVRNEKSQTFVQFDRNLCTFSLYPANCSMIHAKFLCENVSSHPSAPPPESPLPSSPSLPPPPSLPPLLPSLPVLSSSHVPPTPHLPPTPPSSLPPLLPSLPSLLLPPPSWAWPWAGPNCTKVCESGNENCAVRTARKTFDQLTEPFCRMEKTFVQFDLAKCECPKESSSKALFPQTHLHPPSRLLETRQNFTKHISILRIITSPYIKTMPRFLPLLLSLATATHALVGVCQNFLPPPSCFEKPACGGWCYTPQHCAECGIPGCDVKNRPSDEFILSGFHTLGTSALGAQSDILNNIRLYARQDTTLLRKFSEQFSPEVVAATKFTIDIEPALFRRGDSDSWETTVLTRIQSDLRNWLGENQDVAQYVVGFYGFFREEKGV